MASDNQYVPRDPNEVVVPVGKANLVTTKEEADEALEIAGRIFREQGESEMEEITTVEQQVDDDAEAHAATADALETVEPELKKLTQEELDALPKSKFGRDEYGRSLNKDGTPRKGRADKGTARGKYNPRKSKSE